MTLPDPLTPEQRKRAMSNVRTKDGPLETAVRSALWSKGYRFRKHLAWLPGKPDIVFTRAKVAVFCDGDFWHGHDFDDWKDKLKPFWRSKIETNIARDLSNFGKLQEMGWRVVRLWEHEIKKDLDACIDRVEELLRESHQIE